MMNFNKTNIMKLFEANNYIKIKEIKEIKYTNNFKIYKVIFYYVYAVRILYETYITEIDWICIPKYDYIELTAKRIDKPLSHHFIKLFEGRIDNEN